MTEWLNWTEGLYWYCESLNCLWVLPLSGDVLAAPFSPAPPTHHSYLSTSLLTQGACLGLIIFVICTYRTLFFLSYHLSQNLIISILEDFLTVSITSKFHEGRTHVCFCSALDFSIWYHLKELSQELPWWLRGKESIYSGGDPGSIPGLGRSPGERNG